MQVLGVKVTAPDASPTTSDSQQYHQKQSQQQQQQFLLKTSTFSLTVYLDPTTFQQTLTSMTFLSDPPSSTSNKKHSSASSTSPISPKSNLVQNGSWKEAYSRLNQHSQVNGQDGDHPFPVRERFSLSSSSSDRKRGRGGNSRIVIVDQDINYDNNKQNKHDATAAQEIDGEDDGRSGRGISKGPRRLSRHRYPQALIHRLYYNIQPSRDGGRRRTTTAPKTTAAKTMAAKTTATTRRIEVKERPLRLQRLLLLDEQEDVVDENVWQGVINHNHNHNYQQQEQQEQQEQGSDVPSARDDDMYYYPNDRDLADMMNFIIDKELSEYFTNEMTLYSSSNRMNDNHPNGDSPFETKQPQQHQQSTSASSPPRSSSFVSPSLSSGWTQNDIEMARALWNYWEELDAMDQMQAQLESRLEDDNDVHEEIDYETHHSRQGQLRQRPQPQPFKRTLWKGRAKALVKDGTANMSFSPLKWLHDSISVRLLSSNSLSPSFYFYSTYYASRLMGNFLYGMHVFGHGAIAFWFGGVNTKKTILRI
jgi:hypothetical protein